MMCMKPVAMCGRMSRVTWVRRRRSCCSSGRRTFFWNQWLTITDLALMSQRRAQCAPKVNTVKDKRSNVRSRKNLQRSSSRMTLQIKLMEEGLSRVLKVPVNLKSIILRKMFLKISFSKVIGHLNYLRLRRRLRSLSLKSRLMNHK